MLEILLGVWFPADAALDELLLLTTDTVADREQVRFRFRGRNPNGPMIVEEQAYLAGRDRPARELERPGPPSAVRRARPAHEYGRLAEP